MTENYATKVIGEFQRNDINQVLIIDDAFVEPPMDDTAIDILSNFIENSNFRTVISMNDFSDESLHQARIDITRAPYESKAVRELYDVCLIHHNLNQENVPDMNEYLSTLKISTPEDLTELIELLNQCGDNMNIVTTGDQLLLKITEKFSPQIVFLDYRMWDDKSATFERSIELIIEIKNRIKGDSPIFILMSKEIEEQIKFYGKELKNQIMALKFGIIKKGWIDSTEEGLMVTRSAGEVLLDLVFGFNFGNLLDLSLKIWYKGAKCALEKLKEDLYNLHSNDFAYLIKYRLNKEGEVLSDYIEWFLGEALKTMIDNKVNWKDNSFVELDKLNFEKKDVDFKNYLSDHKNIESNVNTIAEIYRNVRISDIDNHRRKRFSLGDLFFSEIKNEVRMVITPDCDIIERGDKNERNAKRLLTVGGKIVEIHDKEAYAKELIFVKQLNSFKSIIWDEVDVCTHEFDGIDSISVDGEIFDYIGTLRPLFAQNLQKEVLAKFSRIGLTVAPTVSFEAKVQTYIDKYEIINLPNSTVTVIMARGGTEKDAIIVFNSEFVRSIFDEIKKIKDEKSELKNSINNIIDCKEKILNEITKGVTMSYQKNGISIGNDITNLNKSLNFVIDFSEI